MHPAYRVNQELEDRKEREAKEALRIAQEKRAVAIPKYHFHTNSSLYKVQNCKNKSNARRNKNKGKTDKEKMLSVHEGDLL